MNDAKKAKRNSVVISITYALYGSIIFALIDTLGIAINSVRLGISSDVIDSFIFSLLWTVMLSIIGWAISVVPAMISGVRIYNVSTKKIQINEIVTEKSCFYKGAIYGGVSAFLITFPIVMVEMYLNFLRAGHVGPISIQIMRAIEVIVIGSVVGGLAGRKIYQQVIKD